jgi:hypothetical protein
MDSHCDPRVGYNDTLRSHADRRIEPAGRDGRNPNPALRDAAGGVPVWLPPTGGLRRGWSCCSAPRERGGCEGAMRRHGAREAPEIHVDDGDVLV